MKDYYKVLGITSGAVPGDIKQAYRQLALQYHPDRNRPTASKEKFIEITEAYEVLSDHNERVKYDRLRREQKQRTQAAKAQKAQKAQRAKPQKERDRQAERRTREQERRWEERGREKAEAYWRMEFNKFIQEVKRGSGTHIIYGMKLGIKGVLFLAFLGLASLVLFFTVVNVSDDSVTGGQLLTMVFVLASAIWVAVWHMGDLRYEWSKYKRDPRT